ncbi:hypothetical protein ACT4UM_10820, partial [Bacillus sp. SS-TM]
MLKRYCIRIMMTCLLAIALCVTWNAFTGVSLLEIVKKYEGTSAKEVHAAEVKRNVAVISIERYLDQSFACSKAFITSLLGATF